MFNVKISVDLRKSDTRRFMSAVCDYLDFSGFTDLECTECRIRATQGWFLGGQTGTLSAIAAFHTVDVAISDKSATIWFGTIRAFIVVMAAITATGLAGLWWLQFERRIVLAPLLAVIVFGVLILQALLRAKIMFYIIARRAADSAPETIP
ncbi:MAG: hypothetical protein ABI454_05690 [Sphingomicrobium sp.]